MREVIPDTARVVRFLLKSEFSEYNGRVYPSMHAFHDVTLSVDWAEKTTLEAAYTRKPKSEAHIIFVTGRLRSIGDESVQHKPEADNYAHSEVVCTVEPANLSKGKYRPTAACAAFMTNVEESGLRPAYTHIESAPDSHTEQGTETSIGVAADNPQ
jgi:hypothetical protein